MPCGLTFGSYNGTTITNTSGTSFTLTPGLGAFVVAFAAWWNTSVGSNSGDVSVSDNYGNTWTRLFPTSYSPDTVAGAVGIGAWYAISNTSASLTITYSLSSGPFSHGNFYAVYWTNAESPYFDVYGTAGSGTSETPISGGITPLLSNDGLILFAAWNSTSGTPNAATLSSGFTFNNRVTGEPITVQDFLFIGQGVSNQSAPFTGTVTTSLASNADWVARLVAIPSSGPKGFTSGDSLEASMGYFSPYQELYFSGSIFLNGYTGIPWLKNVYLLTRDYWDSGSYSRGTPYSGQLYPVGAGTGSPGQMYPY